MTEPSDAQAPDAEPKPPAPSPSLPTVFQRQACWTALTLLALAVTGALVVGFGWLTTRMLLFLQPLLVPIAAAGILAYLLYPLVQKLEDRGQSHSRSVLIVFGGFMLAMTLLAWAIIPPIIGQAAELVSKRGEIVENVKKFANDHKLPTTWDKFRASENKQVSAIAQWLEDPASWQWAKDPATLAKVRDIIWGRIQGLFGVLGYLLGAFLVPVYLFYFLKEARGIARGWSDYVPLRASSFKDEVVGTLQEINTYLIAFFRGQLLVSMIDGVLVGAGLMIIRMPYAILIGVMVGLLGLIPYIGNLMCLLPALAIAVYHYSAPANHIFGIQQLWLYPLLVIAVFTITQQLNHWITTPKIIGDAVGLHPLTVIFSVLFWTFLIGGFLGSLLAVPLTASVKVLFRRYIWEARWSPGAHAPATP